MKAGVVASFLLAEEDVQVGRTCMPAAGGGGVLLNKWNRYNTCVPFVCPCEVLGRHMATPPPRSRRSRLRVAGFRLWTVRGKTFEVPGG